MLPYLREPGTSFQIGRPTAVPNPVQYFLGMPAIINSIAMRNLMETVQKVARTSAAVLITGESGTGKELIARALHHYSMRCSKPFVDISCAALPEHLAESELFGYDKGAFSGADVPKPGLFEMAHTGTLFLDEIGELETKMQVKLLRVLDGTPYYRLGGTRKVAADTRIVAATNQNLEAMIGQGRFRNDLFHRLTQFHMKLPPLRDRLEDIRPLAEFFLAQQNPEMCFTPPALERLRRHTWPGNVRELRNVVIKSAVLTRDQMIGPQDLPEAFHQANNATEPSPHTLDGMERQMIISALSQNGGHHQRAAEKLGISRRTLSRKLKLYGRDDLMEPDDFERQ